MATHEFCSVYDRKLNPVTCSTSAVLPFKPYQWHFALSVLLCLSGKVQPGICMCLETVLFALRNYTVTHLWHSTDELKQVLPTDFPEQLHVRFHCLSICAYLWQKLQYTCTVYACCTTGSSRHAAFITSNGCASKSIGKLIRSLTDIID